MFFSWRKRCKIVYRSEYLTAVHSSGSHRTFDVKRFKKVRDELLRNRLIRRRDILKADMLSEADLLLVHTREYLNDLRNPMVVGRALHLDYVNPWDNYILEYFKYLAGGTVLAAEFAMRHQTTVFNLGGGYHHAHADRSEGCCLINDAAIAIEKLRRQNELRRVLVIDLDYHQGNGTAIYYKDNPDVFTFSIHGEGWVEIEKDNNLDIALPAHTGDEVYLRVLRKKLAAVFQRFKPELVIYLAGSDPFILDALGDFDISEKGMLERDIFVYQQVRERRLPLAIVAGGGYGPQSWRVYYNFIKWVIQKG